MSAACSFRWTRAAQAAGVRLQLARNPVAALRVIEHDEVLGQPGAVLVEAPHLDRAPGAAAGREKAMAVGERGRFDVEHQRAGGAGRASDRERHDAAAIEEQQPADRPAEQQLPAPVVQLRVPVHLLGEREVAQQGAQQVRQRVDRALAAMPLVVREILPFRRRDARELFERDALLLGEPQPGRCRGAVRTDRRPRPAGR